MVVMCKQIIFMFCFLNLLRGLSSQNENDSCGRSGRGVCKTVTSCPGALEMIFNQQEPITCGIERNHLIVCCEESNANDRHRVPNSPSPVPYESCGPADTGVCKPVKECPSALELIAKKQKPISCGFHQNEPLVCCEGLGTTSQRQRSSLDDSLSISQKKCKEYEETVINTFFCKAPKFKRAIIKYTPFVIGGVQVKPKELPFMGLVGYGTKNDIDWACGCSLISHKFVLSAGHCSQHPSGGPANWVRLGEHDTQTRNNSYAPPLEFRILRRINHPKYNPNLVYNDIALFELDQRVEFSDSISPICLPTINSADNVETVTGAGWGIIEVAGPRSNILMKVDLNLYRIDQCLETASDRVKVPRGLDRDTMICAGSLDGGKDTCSGDSGGPLFIPQKPNETACKRLTQLGVTSFGKQCALKGVPAIYTNVLRYVTWIESVVWPSNDTKPKPNTNTPRPRPTSGPIWH